MPRAASSVRSSNEQERALEAEPLVAPDAVGEGDEARLVLGRAGLPEQQRLARRVRLAGAAVGEEAPRGTAPTAPCRARRAARRRPTRPAAARPRLSPTSAMRGSAASTGSRRQQVEVDAHLHALERVAHEAVDQPHAVAGRALVPGRAGLVGPDHPGDVEVRPGGALRRRSAG